MNRLSSTVNNGLYFSYIRLPSSAALSVRVRNVVAEANCLIAIFAFCHFDTPVQIFVPEEYILFFSVCQVFFLKTYSFYVFFPLKTVPQILAHAILAF